MKVKELKSGLFGYQKSSVYRYITDLEEQFSGKLVEKDREIQALTQKYQEQIAALEEQVRSLEAGQAEGAAKSAGIPDEEIREARQYAQRLKREAESQAQEAARRLEERIARQDQELERYDQQIRQLRERLRGMILEMDASAEQLESSLEEVQTAGRDRNMSLFQRKKKPEPGQEGDKGGR